MKENGYYLSLDLGTQGTKAAVISRDGTVLRSEFTANCFYESDEGEISISGERMREGVIAATRAVLQNGVVTGKEILAVSVVGMMAGTIGIDENWNSVTPYDTGLDKRCESAIREMQQLGEDEVIRLSGCPIIVAQGAKMYWWKTRRPEVFEKVKKFVPASSYICGCMAGLKSGEAYIDYTQIHLTCFADVEKEIWSDDLLRLFQFPKEKLPRIVAPYEVIGRVTEEWAGKTGLLEGTPILAGCGDTAASSLGAGLVKEHMVLDVAGSGKSCSFEELARETEQVDCRNLFFLPYFAGRICPSNPRFSGHWIGLKFYHGRAHMFKSIMESIAFEYRIYEVYFKLKEYLGFHEEIKPFREGTTCNNYDERILDYFGIDFLKVPLENAEIEDLEEYPWPKAQDMFELSGLKEKAEALYRQGKYAISFRAPVNGIFEIACWMRGMQNFMMDMLSDEDFAHALTEKILEVQMDWYGYILDEIGPYVDIVETGDDYGSQNSLLASPECLEEFILSKRKRLNDLIRKKAPNAKIFLHSCGSIARIIPNLSSCGVDILNPVQTAAANMDPYTLKKEYGDLICFHGGIDSQRALRGTRKDVEDEVKRMLDAMNHRGGYILSSCNHIQGDVPPENIVTMFETARKYC